MKTIHVSIRQIGNSKGVVIPKALLAQLGLNGATGADLKISEAGDDAVVMGEFGNAADTDITW